MMPDEGLNRPVRLRKHQHSGLLSAWDGVVKGILYWI